MNIAETKVFTTAVKLIWLSYKSTKESTALTIGGTEVSASVIIPKRLIDKLDSAAALGSVTNNNAVAIADEFPPNVTPLVT